MATLDRTRHFAENFGFVENGAKYVQDGIDFDAHGDEIVAIVEEPEAETKISAKKTPSIKTADII